MRVNPPPRLRAQVLLFTLIRVVINTGFRMVYPLAPAFMAGLGISFARYSTALQVRSWVGGASPLLAAVSDRFGRKVGMLAGLLLFIAGLVTVVLFPNYAGFLISLMLIILGKYIFDPAMQAYLGDRVSYERRGLVLAVTEFGWSGATLAGIPLAGLLIARAGWLAPFPLIVVLSIVLLAILFWLVPRDPGDGQTGNPFRRFREVFTSRPALSGLAVTLWLCCANELVNLVFGVWLEGNFGLSIAALGASAIVLGGAELLGEGLVGALSDRLGKQRAVALGLLLNSGAAILLPLIGTTATGAFIGLFIFYLTFEFALVSSIPMMTEVLPAARATLMAFNIAAASVGRALAAVAVPALFAAWGFGALAGVAAGVNLLALWALRGVRLAEE
jgi:predicted MFS family arabinose efflux permease